MALACSIFGTYYVLSSYSDSMICTLFFAFLSVAAVSFYLGSCQYLFHIPDIFRLRRELCHAMLHRVQKRGFEQLSIKIRKRRLAAIPLIGYKDGSFRVLESSSSLSFIDFYVTNVITLLLL